MNPILLQTMYYAIVMLLAWIMMELLMQGFPHKFLSVFASLGRKNFVKIRLATYDGIAIGSEDEGFLCFKFHGKKYRIPISRDKKFFYRFLFVQWVDIDGEKWALSKTDYTPVSGYDPVKIENFLLRILMAPKGDDKMMKILMILLIVALVAIVGLFIFDFTLMQKLGAMQGQLGSIASNTAKTITPATI